MPSAGRDTGTAGPRGSDAADSAGATACVPNVYRTLSRHAPALAAMQGLEAALDSGGRLAEDEHAVVALEVARAYCCEYCQAAFVSECRHRGVDAASIDAVLAGALPSDTHYRRLVRITRRIMERHGRLGGAEQALLEDSGLELADLLEIVTIIAAYTLATYANNLAGTRIDPVFR